MSADAAEVDKQQLSVKEALSLLTSLQASQVLPVLRHTDFMMVAGLAFAGFRQDAGGYGNPIVRRRLAEEAAKNPAFAKKLRQLSTQPKPVAEPTVAAATKNGPPAVQHQSRNDIDRETEKYRAERDRLKQERDAAVAAKQAAERLLVDAKRELIAAQTAKAESDREAERAKQRLERSERKHRQLEATNSALRRAAIHTGSAPAPNQPTPMPVATTAPSVNSDRPFADAIRHLLGKQKEAVALSIVTDVLRASPDDVDALSIKADALINISKEREAVPVLRTLISIQLKRDLFSAAAGSLAKLLTVTPSVSGEARQIREFMAALPRCAENLDQVTEPLTALRASRPESFQILKSQTPATWAAQLFPEQTTYEPDAPLPLVLASQVGMILTARKLVAAIERNDWPIVELAQDALKKKDSDDAAKILLTVTRTAEGDPVYESVLRPKVVRGPVVVDCSNVVWHGQEHNAQQQPRLTYVLAIRRLLWLRGFFPVLLVADANFPYIVSDPALARKMVDEEQIQLVMGGSDADEHILREAQRLNAPIVTNDYMVDWDPSQNIIKYQYTFSPEGKPTVYF